MEAIQAIADAGQAGVESAVELVAFGGHRMHEVPAPGLRSGQPGWVSGGVMERGVERHDARHPVVEIEPDRFRLAGIGRVPDAVCRFLAARFDPASRAECQVEIRARGPRLAAEHPGTEERGEADDGSSGGE